MSASATAEEEKTREEEKAANPDAPPVQLSFAVGGKEPTSASLRIVGGKIEVDGEFEKGDVVVLSAECTISEVGFVDVYDEKTGVVVGCERRQKAKPIAPWSVEAS